MIKDKEKALLLARFLVEDNDEDIVFFNEEMELNINMIKSRFKNVVGKVTIFSNEEETKLHESLIPV